MIAPVPLPTTPESYWAVPPETAKSSHQIPAHDAVVANVAVIVALALLGADNRYASKACPAFATLVAPLVCAST